VPPKKRGRKTQKHIEETVTTPNDSVSGGSNPSTPVNSSTPTNNNINKVTTIQVNSSIVEEAIPTQVKNESIPPYTEEEYSSVYVVEPVQYCGRYEEGFRSLSSNNEEEYKCESSRIIRLDALGQPDSEIFLHEKQWVIVPIEDDYQSGSCTMSPCTISMYEKTPDDKLQQSMTPTNFLCRKNYRADLGALGSFLGTSQEKSGSFLPK